MGACLAKSSRSTISARETSSRWRRDRVARSCCRSPPQSCPRSTSRPVGSSSIPRPARSAKAMPWRASILTLFPEMFPGPLGLSLAGKALAAGVWSLDAHDIRAHATDKHGTVDDTPAGGGPGMVMKADVLARAIDAVAADHRPRFLMSARGAPLTQARVRALAKGDGAVIVCGRFEG